MPVRTMTLAFQALRSVAGAWLMYYDELKNVSLWEYDEAELDDYAQELMESFAEDNPEYLGIVMAENVPFVVFREE